MISKFKTKKKKTKMKFGVKVLATVEEAMELDAENGDILWQDTINKETANSRIDFETLEEGESASVGCTQLICYLIFDVKMDPTRKARYVAGGPPNRPPIVYDIRQRSWERGSQNCFLNCSI